MAKREKLVRTVMMWEQAPMSSLDGGRGREVQFRVCDEGVDLDEVFAEAKGPDEFVLFEATVWRTIPDEVPE